MCAGACVCVGGGRTVAGAAAMVWAGRQGAVEGTPGRGLDEAWPARQCRPFVRQRLGWLCVCVCVWVRTATGEAAKTCVRGDA